MPFCSKCGANLADGASFCAKCGTATSRRPVDIGDEITSALNTAGRELEAAFKTAGEEIEKAFTELRHDFSQAKGPFCIRCGKRNPEGAKFCLACGREIPQTSQEH